MTHCKACKLFGIIVILIAIGFFVYLVSWACTQPMTRKDVTWFACGVGVVTAPILCIGLELLKDSK